MCQSSRLRRYGGRQTARRRDRRGTRTTHTKQRKVATTIRHHFPRRWQIPMRNFFSHRRRRRQFHSITPSCELLLSVHLHESPHQPFFLRNLEEKEKMKKKVANLMIFGEKIRKFRERKFKNLPDFNTWIIFFFHIFNSQIWLNQLMDNHHLSYIIKLWGKKRKKRKKTCSHCTPQTKEKF